MPVTPGPGRRLQLRDAIAAALAADGKPEGLAVRRARALPFSAKQLPAVAVYLMPELVETGPGPGTAPIARRKLLVRVQAQVACAADEEDVDLLLDPITTWVVQAVLADPSLGGLAITTTERQTQFAVTEDTEPVFGGATIDFVVDYLTAAADPTRKT